MSDDVASERNLDPPGYDLEDSKMDEEVVDVGSSSLSIGYLRHGTFYKMEDTPLDLIEYLADRSIAVKVVEYKGEFQWSLEAVFDKDDYISWQGHRLWMNVHTEMDLGLSPKELKKIKSGRFFKNDRVKTIHCQDYEYLEFLMHKKINGNFRSKRKFDNPYRALLRADDRFDNKRKMKNHSRDIHTEAAHRMFSGIQVRHDSIGFSSFSEWIRDWLGDSFASSITNLLVDIEVFLTRDDVGTIASYAAIIIDCVALVTTALSDCTMTIKASALWSFLRLHGLESAKFVMEKLYSAIPSVTVKTESYSDKAQYAHDLFHKILNSDVVGVIRQLILSAVSFKLFSKDLAFDITKVLGPPNRMSLLDSIDLIMGSVVRLLRVADLLLEGAPLSKALFNDDHVGALIDNVNDHIMASKFLYMGIPKDGHMDAQVWLIKANEYIKTADIVLPKLRKDDVQSKYLKRDIVALREIQVEQLNKIMGHKRKSPFLMILHGTPSIGKSTILQYNYRLFHTLAYPDLPFQDTMVYTRVNTSDYFEGYDPISQPYMHYPEGGAIHANIAKVQGYPQMVELTAVVDNLPLPADMAFGKKGSVFIMPSFVAIDTNNQFLHDNLVSSNPMAFRRRAIYVEPKVLPEFTKNKSAQLDPKKSLDSLESGREYMDRWKFRVTAWNVESATKGHEVVLGDNLTIYGYTKLMEKLMREHLDIQQRIYDMHRPDMDPLYYLNHDGEISFIKPEEEQVRPLQALLDKERSNEDSTLEEKEEVHTEGGFLQQADGFFEKLKKKSNDDKKRRDVEAAKKRASVALWTEDPESYERLQKWQRDTYEAGTTNVMALHMFLFSLPETLAGGLIYYGGELWYANWMKSLRNKMPFPNLWLQYFAFLFTLLGPILGLSSVWWLFSVIYTLFSTFTISETKKSLLRVVVKQAYKANLKTTQVHWKNVKYIFGLGDEVNPKYGLWWNTHGGDILRVTGVLTAAFVAYRKYKQYTTPKVVLEPVDNYVWSESSEFEEKSEDATHLNQLEDLVEADRSFQRKIKIKGSSQWNSMYGVRSNYTGTIGSLENTIKNNIRITRIIYPDRKEPGKTFILGLRGDVGMFNLHVLGRYDVVHFEVCTTGSPYAKDNVVYKTTQINRKDVVKVTDDIGIVRLNQLQFADISDYFIESDEFESPALKGRTRGFNVDVTYYNEVLPMKDELAGTVAVHKYFEMKVEHSDGDCGQPLLLELGRRGVIAGIHIAGEDAPGPSCFSKLVLLFQVKRALETESKSRIYFKVHSEGVIPSKGVMPSHKSMLRYRPLHGIEYHGSDGEKVFINQKSRLKPTAFGSELKDSIEKIVGAKTDKKFVPPIMAPGWYDRGDSRVYLDPYGIAMKEISGQRAALDDNLMQRVISEMVTEIGSKIGDVQLKPWDVQTAINGCKDDPLIRRMNATTSAGYAYKGKKKDYIPIVREDVDSLVREPNFKAKINATLESYRLGQTVHPIISGVLKDEPRDVKKVYEGKTRLFCVVDIEQVLLMRMFAGPFFAEMLDKGFNTAIGINAHKDGSALWEKLLGFSHNIMSGDYKAYDQTLPFQVMMAAATVIYEVMASKGYNAEALKILAGILTERMYPLLNVLGDNMIAPGYHTSGGAYTAEFNCIAQEVMLRYFYEWLRANHVLFGKFSDHILPYTYGDDGLVSVKDEVASVFNNVTYQLFCREVFLMEYTDAHKSDNISPFDDITTLTFLKRSFVFSDEFNKVMMPLDINSIVKSLLTYIPSATVSFQQQMDGTFQSALRELFFHCTKEQYDSLWSMFCKIYEEEFHERPWWSANVERTSIITQLQW